MSIPSQTLTVRDPGLALAPAAINSVLYLGRAEKGDLNTVYAFSSASDVVDTLGEGPLSEDLAYHLSIAGAPVYAVALDGTAGAAGAVTPTRVGTSTGTITVAGAARDAYSVIVEFTATGGLGGGDFSFSLDDGYTWSPTLLVPSGGTYTIARTGLTLTFVPGAGPTIFEKGDKHKFVCTAPTYGPSEINDALVAVAASGVEFALLILSGEHADANTAVTLYGQLSLGASTLMNQFRYVRVLVDAGSDDAGTTIDTFDAIARDQRMCVVYGDAVCATAKPFMGWGVPRRAAVGVVAARAGAILPSTDPARNADGPLRGVRAISHDEFRTQLMDQHGFTTLRTWQGATGFYITNARLMSPPGSDYQYLQHGRLMDIACDVTYKTQMPFMNSAFALNDDGTISALDAERWEQAVTAALTAVLIDPDNAEGTQGHVSALGYAVNRQANVAQTNNVRTKVAIRPLGYAKQITTELGFTAGGV